MKHYSYTIFLVVLIFSSTFSIAGVIHVPQDQPTIQAGINASANGDTVLVAENTYYENINFNAKWITVASHYIMDGDTTHINNTIIDGSRPSHPDSGSVVSFTSGFEDTNSVLTGFTITGGTGTKISGNQYSDKDGGGILIRYSGAKIVKNKIINNHITADGDVYAGGSAIAATNDFGDLIVKDNIIRNNSATVNGSAQAFATVGVNSKNTCIVENNYIHNNELKAPNSSAFAAGLFIDGWDNQVGTYIIRNNTIRDNKINASDGGGGGVVIQNCKPLFYNNIISGNAAASWGGGGLWIVHFRLSKEALAPQPHIMNNTIVNNSATGPGGGILIQGAESYAYLINNIVWGNSGSPMAQIRPSGGADIQIRYSIVQGNYSGEGNFNINPMLVADSLTNESPAIGRGTVEYDFGEGIVLHCPLSGINGRERPFPQGSGPDVGAWESNLEFPTGIDAATDAELSKHFTLQQNYPNPFNPTTIIAYDLPRPGNVKLTVHNALGQQVAELVHKNQQAGSHTVTFDAEHLPTGIYVYHLQINGEYSIKKKMMLLK